MIRDNRRQTSDFRSWSRIGSFGLISAVCGLLSVVLIGCGSSLPTAVEDLPLFPTETPLPTLTPTPEPEVTPTLEPYTIEGLKRFFADTAAGRLAGRQDLVNRYVGQMPETPLTSFDEAAIVYQGPGRKVEVIGDMNNWSEPAPLEQLPDTDFWVLILTVEPAARLDYKLIVDGQEQLDPRNPLTEVSPLGLRSKLVMPGFQPPPAFEPVGDAAAGQLDQEIIESTALNQTRTIFIYTPSAPAPPGGYPAVYFLDGTDHINLIDTPNLLDRMIAAEAIPPVVAVFVPPIDRLSEYSLNDDYVNFLADEVVSFVQRSAQAGLTAADTTLVGQGSGGATAVYSAASRPETFGQVISQSGYFTLRDEIILRQFSLRDPIPVSFYLTVGTYETAIDGDSVGGNLIAVNQELAARLTQQGYRVILDEQPEGHSWGLWRDRLPTALQIFLNP